MADAVLLENVSKIFDQGKPQQTVAVDDLSLTVRKGEIFALVGPDGAGKTTTIRLMCGVLKPTQGRITIADLDMETHRDDIKDRIGYLSQRFSLYGDLSIDENIDFFAEIHKIRDHAARKEELLRFTRLTPFRDRLADRLSGGMKQKLALACTLIHTPEVIFLDEPTTGVDLDEAERSTRVALMNQGRLLTCDTPERVKASFGRVVVEISCPQPRQALAVLKGSQGISDAQLFGDRLHLVLDQAHPGQEQLVRDLEARGIAVSDSRTIVPSLEDVFISRISSPAR